MLTVLLIGVSVIQITVPLLRNRDKLSKQFDAEVYEKKYNASQYMVPMSKHPISDEEIYVWASYKYATGSNPILVNSDHPPLAKYVIGFFLLLTNNPKTASFVFAGLTCILLYSFVYTFTKSHLLSSLALFFLSADTVFMDQIIYAPLLDLFQAFFLMCFILSVCLWLRNRRNVMLVFAGIALGMVASSKMYFPAFLAAGVFGLFVIIAVKEPIRALLRTVPVIMSAAGATYLASYTMFFLTGNSIVDFAKSQKWIFLYWSTNSAKDNSTWGSIFPFVLFNRWKIWWGDRGFISYEHWSVFWPILFVLAVLSMIAILVLYAKRRTKAPPLLSGSLFITLWNIFLLLYLSFTPISPRYLLLFYLPSYVLIAFTLHQQFKAKKYETKKT